MRSGCPNSHGGTYPPMDVAALTSPQDNTIRPAPVVHSANGAQINYWRWFRMAYSPAQCQQGYAQSQQNVQELYYQQESQTRIASTEYQHSKSEDHAFTLQSSHHQMRRVPNAYADLSARVPLQHRSYFGISAYEDSVRQTAFNSGQQRESSEQCYREHSLKGSNLNNITGLKQGQHRNSASSGNTSSAALQGDSPEVSTQTRPLQDQCPRAPKSKLHKHSPLLFSLLKGNTPPFESCLRNNFSDERHCKHQQVKSSLASLNCGQTSAQNLEDSGGPHSSPSQQNIYSSSLSGQPSTDKVLAVGGGELPTDEILDDEILNYINEQVSYFKSVLTNAWNISESNSVACLPSTSDKGDLERQSLSCPVSEQSTTAAGQALEEDRVKDSHGHAELQSKGKCDTCASEKHSTEYPQIMLEVAATCTKSEEESPVVLTTVSSSQGKSLWVNAYKNLDGCDRVPGVSWALKHATHKGKRDTGPKPAEVVETDSVQGMMTVSKDIWTPGPFGNQDANINKQKNTEDQQHCRDTCKEVAVQSKLNTSIDKIQIHNAASATTNQSEQTSKQTSRKSMREDAANMSPEAGLRRAFSKNSTPLSGSVGEQTFSVTVLKAPQYEDISDPEDVSQLDTKSPNTEHEKLSYFEDISEDESPEVSETNIKQCGHVQVQAQMKSISDEAIPKKQVSPKTAEVPQHCSCPCFVETDNGFERVLCPTCDSERHLEWQTNQACSPSFVLKNEDETDDQMEDDWLVIPLSISDVKFEPPNADQADPEKVLLNDGEHGDKETQGYPSPALGEHALNPVPASAFSQMEVFGTYNSLKECFEMALGTSIPERTPHTLENMRDSSSEPEDSSETEDSCYYSSDPERNYLTVSKKFLNNLSALTPSQTRDSESEKENQDDEATNSPKGQSRRRRKTSKKTDEMVLDGETEDESDQNCTKQTKRRKRLSSSHLEDSGAAPRSQQKRHSPETMDSPSEDTPAPQCLSRFHEVTQDACSQDGTEKREQKFKSDHVQCEITRKKSSDDDSVILLDSDTEEDSNQNYRKTERNSVFSSKSVHDGTASHVKQKSKPETVDSEHETAKERLQEPKLSSAVSSKPKHRYKPLMEEMQDACTDLAHSTKTQQLIEAKVCSVQQKTNRQTLYCEPERLVKKDRIRKKRRRILSSEEEDSDDASVDAQTNAGASKTPGAAGSDPVIPRFIVQKSSQHGQHLKLYRQHKDETRMTPKIPTATSKKTNSSEKMRHTNRDKKGKFSKLKPANVTHHATPLSKSKERSSSPRQHSSSSTLQWPRSSSDPSTSHHPDTPTSSSTAKQSPATKPVNTSPQNSFVPNRTDSKPSRRMEEDLRIKNNSDSLREAKPGHSHNDRAPRRRRSSYESTTRLMKRARLEAMQLTRARNQDTTKEQSFPVSGGYKWKTPAGTLAKGSCRHDNQY